jgi:hypothetical protein
MGVEDGRKWRRLIRNYLIVKIVIDIETDNGYKQEKVHQRDTGASSNLK